ncbi:alkaline serine protease Alp1 [Cordyceps militaris]|uniref:Alkaline serine protease Alp1 n=1 Tax=Cordyceps militaris TaxID=73501 RepID=A0A2H4SC07_CORMI|nr:alkaline serine protease Alp1 [Cordyceps militaris]
MPALKKLLTILTAALYSSALVGAAEEQKYIVVLKEGISARSVDFHIAQARNIHSNSLGRRELDLAGIEDTYSIGDFQGYSGTFDNDTVAKIQNLAEVDRIVPDQAGKELVLVRQDNSDYGLASISNRGPGATLYRYDDTAGKGTFGYVVDSGIQSSHPEFEGRVTQGYSFDGNFDNPTPHGTMVAGVLASKTYGVAKKAEIINVRISSAQQRVTGSSILGGINWAVNDIVDRGRVGKAVINVSQSGGFNINGPSPINSAVEAAFRLGILTIAAAGNDFGTVESESITPGSAPNALTVGAIDKSWKFSDFSNHGKMVDILAPGTDVLTISSKEAGAVRTSGTSLAAPYVAGIALYLCAVQNFRTAKDLTDRIKALGTPGKASNLPANTVNLVAYNGAPALDAGTVVFEPGRELPEGAQ